jgi:IS5 family transposase
MSFMKFFKSQSWFDFDPPTWKHDPELFVMDQILEKKPQIIMLAAPCFPKARAERQAPVGRDGMTLEQVVRCAIYQRHKALTWRQLSEQIEDSKKGRHFTKMAYEQHFSHQALQENISKITPAVLEKIHVAICQYGVDLGIDDGKKVRTDSTAIETNIHHPTNASLLWDSIRVAGRLLQRTQELLKTVTFRRYQKVGKKLLFKIVNTKGAEKRRPLFKKMLKYQKADTRQVQTAIQSLSACTFTDATQEKQRQALLADLEALLPNIEKIADVAYRREILDEQVPVDDKLFSLFETHTDCIVKGQRDVIFGHKVNFTAGKSNLIFDCILERGNPADSSYFQKTLDNLAVHFNITPRDAASDGGYASRANLEYAQAKGIGNIVFNKVKGSQQNITSSKKMETMLKKWRSGIEAMISNFRRGLEASLCTWKGWEAFKSFILWSVITFNLRIMARRIVAKLAVA